MKVIGITGQVGSGKSFLLKALSEKYNCKVLYADLIAKELEEKGQRCYTELVDLLGRNILGSDDQIDKKKMSDVIFMDPENVKKVNDIIHPAVWDYIVEKIEAYRKTSVDYVFLEAALLIECGYRSLVDEMWFIYVEDSIRRERLKSSRGYTDEKIDSILRNQLSYDDFIKNTDFCVDNSKDLENSLRQIAKRLG